MKLMKANLFKMLLESVEMGYEWLEQNKRIRKTQPILDSKSKTRQSTFLHLTENRSMKFNSKKYL